MRTFTRFSDRFLIFLFTLIIFIPGTGMFVKKQVDEFRKQFNREPYQFPHIDVKNLGRTDFKGIENWFVDRALFMTTLSKIWSNLNYKLGTSIKPGQAIIGKEDWLFLGNDYSATIDQFTGKSKPGKEEIYLQLSALKHMQTIASQNNIPFIVVIAPDKQDIYPEYLPKNIQKGTNKNRLELLEESMLANGIDYVSLKQKELKAKNTLGKQYGDLYLKGDSHWNYVGAYAAYQALSEKMKHHGIKINDLKINFVPQQTTYSDISNFLQLTNIYSNSPLPDITQLKLNLIGKDISGATHKMGVFEGSPDILNAPYQNINKAIHNKQTCLLIGDSFSEALSFYFHNDFYNTVRIHPGNKAWNLSDLINTYHPDIIVYEKVERDLFYPLFNFQVTSEKVNFDLPEYPLSAKGQIEKFKISKDRITTYGWAYIPNQDASFGEVYLKFTKDKETYLFSMDKTLNQSFRLVLKNDGKHLNLAGFNGTILRKNIPNGVYDISLVVRNKELVREKKFSNKYQQF